MKSSYRLNGKPITEEELLNISFRGMMSFIEKAVADNYEEGIYETLFNTARGPLVVTTK